MALGKKESLLSEVFQLLEQKKLLEHSPHSSRQIRKDKKISARIQVLVDRICVEQQRSNRVNNRIKLPQARPQSRHQVPY